MFVSATHSPMPCHTSDCLQRRPSFPQVGSGEWNLGRKLFAGHRNPTAASMAAEQQDDEEDAEADVTSGNVASGLHAGQCRCSSNTPGLPAGTDSNQNSGPSFLKIQPDATVCTCQVAGVTLGGLTAPDGSRTSLASAVANSNKKIRRPRAHKTTVIFNVGGQIFETYRSTLKRFKNSFFADDDKMRAYFRPTHGDYFFDRDPTAFGAVLNYLRTGELHVPTTTCGPALQNELEFWGIDELDIERCCWTQYNTWKTQSRSLEKLEYDRKFSTTQNLQALKSKNAGCWGRARATTWTFLQDPGSSRPAKGYAWVSIIFVFISIFSFCAETHPFFRVRLQDVPEFSSLYRFFNLEALQSLKGSRQIPDRRNGTQTSGALNGTASHREDAGKEAGDESELPHPSLLIMDLCCLIFFSMEYLTRFACSPSKLNFLRSFQNIIDFVAISPDYVELLFLVIDPMRREGNIVMDLMFILRMLRLCRIFRLIRHVPGLWILLYTLKASFNELMLMCVFLLIGMVVFATLMHFVEGQNGFRNIPVGFWWSVVTMTTVGYGDIVPKTAGGYVIGSCCAVAGLLMIAFTVPIIVSNFVLYYTHVQYGLARRDREIERMNEEQGGGGDEESQGGTESGAGSRTDLSDVRLLSSAPRKTPVDSTAVCLGQDVSLTAPAATDDEREVEKCRFEIASDLVQL